jgi:hypothetical protein
MRASLPRRLHTTLLALDVQMEYVCDESGCVVVFPGQSTADDGDVVGLSISGEDWKVDSRRWACRAGDPGQA